MDTLLKSEMRMYTMSSLNGIWKALKISKKGTFSITLWVKRLAYKRVKGKLVQVLLQGHMNLSKQFKTDCWGCIQAKYLFRARTVFWGSVYEHRIHSEHIPAPPHHHQLSPELILSDRDIEIWRWSTNHGCSSLKHGYMWPAITKWA